MTSTPAASAHDAGQALRRIAFLLERQRASTYKIRAFRGASTTVMKLDDDELARHLTDGTLKTLPGIGDATRRVIETAAVGETPEYLAELEETSGPLADGGTAVRAALKGDLHCHSDWSDGGSPIEEMVMTAVELGHEYLVLTDHSPRLRVANGLSAARLQEQLKVIRAVNRQTDGVIRLLKGIEVDILDDGTLDQTPAMLRLLDVRVASVHSKLKMERDAMTRRMVNAVRNPFTNVLGHCTGQLIEGNRGTRPQSQFDPLAVFEACAENNVAVEINSRPERSDPPDNLIRMALNAGCLFSIDSDAHAPGQLDFQIHGCVRAERLGVPLERIVNTWDADRLLDWANGRVQS